MLGIWIYGLQEDSISFRLQIGVMLGVSQSFVEVPELYVCVNIICGIDAIWTAQTFKIHVVRVLIFL